MLHNDGIPTQDLEGPKFPGANASDFDIIGFLMRKFDLPDDGTTAIKIINLLSKVRCRGAIVKACEDGDYNRAHQVLKDGGLYGDAKHSSSDPAKNRSDPEVLRRLEVSFRGEYMGNAVDGLYKYLKNNTKLINNTIMSEEQYYGKFCSIVQSSGTGKSRTMIELRTRGVIVLYMNLRDREEKNVFPARDDVIADLLTGRQLKDGQWVHSPAECGDICYALFTAIFRVLKSTFEEYSVTMSGARELIDHWNNEMCDLGSDKRNQWLKELKNQCDKELNAMLVIEPEYSHSDTSLGSSKAIPIIRKTPILEAFEAWRDFASEKLVLSSNWTRPQLVIEFDDAHILNSGQDYCLTHLLCRVIQSFRHSPFSPWVLFASTTSQEFEFPFDSIRITRDGQNRFPPYIHLGWDQHAKDIRELDPDDMAKLDYIAHLGRPLWVSLMNAMDSPMILKTATEKLCGGSTYDPYDEDQVLAVLGARFCIDIHLGHLDLNRFSAEAVANHMRVPKSTASDGTLRSTIYPSEPLLACVAANCLHQTNESLDLSLEVLCDKLLDEMVETRYGGELISRLLLLVAKDFYCRSLPIWSGNILTDEDELSDCVPVPVGGCLKFMFGEGVIRPDDEKRLDGWYLNFTHWISMTGDSGDTKQPEFAKSHWCRTSAVQYCHKRAEVNKIIPIYFKGSQSRFSYIFISDRKSDRSSKAELDSITHETIFGYESSEPYVVILLDMGVPASERTAPRECEWGPSGCGPCRIYVPGITATSFPFLEGYPNILALLGSMIVPERASAPTSSKVAKSVRFRGI